MSNFTREKDAEVVARRRSEYASEAGKAKHRRNIRTLFVISLAVTLLLSILNWGIISGWGKVKISRMTLSGTNGEKMSVLLYKPDSATADTPAPAVICYHGNAGNARNHESWAVEFARRGYVVVVPDMLGAGMDYVDHNNIFTAGHSMGGTTAYAVAAEKNAKGVLIASNRFASHIAKKKDEPSVALYEKIQGYVGDVIMVYGDVEKGIDEQAMCDLMNGWITAKVERGYTPYQGLVYEKTDTTIFLKSTILGYFQDKDKEARLRAEQQRRQEQKQQ